MSRRLALQVRLVWPALARLAIIIVVASIAGALFGAVVALSVALLLLFLFFALHLHYLSLLGLWLERQQLSEIPDGWGTWAEVYARLYKARRASEVNERRLEENEQRFRRTISALPEGIVLIDAALQIEWCNPVAERHLGIRLSDDQGLRLTNLVRDPVFIAYMTSRNFERPVVFRPLATPGCTLSILVVEFEPARSIVISHDVTQSERVDAMRRDFVANVSHELRTPLTVVNGFLETLLDAEPPLDEQRQHHLRLMYEQGSRMHRLVEDLLMLSRLEAAETPMLDEDIDVPRLVHDLEAEARMLSAGRHRFQVDTAPGHVRGSRDELRSAFGNLVSNAIRYTPSGGSIALRWNTDDEGATFEVEDSGIGIALEHLPRLTERFYRVDKSRSRETGGTGLGLAIVKHVVLRHHGRLDIESQPGHGSTFRVWLPASRVIGGSSGSLRRAA